MKKRLASISMAVALILSSLSTAGMSVFAGEADAPTTATTVVSTTAADETTTASTTATTEDSASTTASRYAAPNYKDVLGDIAGKVVSKVISKKTTTAASTTTTTTTTTAAVDETTTANPIETTIADSAETTTAADVTTTTTAQSVPVTPVKPASPNYKAIAEKVITKILSKKYSPVIVANKNLIVSKGHYTMVNATGKGKISYFSMNKKVATVDKLGIVKGVSQGSTKIRVIAWGNSEYYPSSTYVTVKVTPSWSDIFAPLFK